MTNKLSIPEVRTYLCPICNIPYVSLENAIECRDKGLIEEGPEINPGLVVRGIYPDVYSMFFRESRKNHNRLDEFANFKIGLRWDKKTKSERESLIHVKSHELNAYLKRDQLNEIQSRISFLDEFEFTRFINFVDKFMEEEENFKDLSLNALYALENLYNYHSYFDNQK